MVGAVVMANHASIVLALTDEEYAEDMVVVRALNPKP